MQDKYVNPFTDFGFKKLFGEEPHKELLFSFLNTLLPAKHQIQDLPYTLKNVTDTAWEEGKEEGLAEGREEGREEGAKTKALAIARNLLDVLDNTTIALKTGLSAEEVQCLRESV